MINNLQKIIDSGESQNVEFKSAFGKEVIESIVAFSNSKGGKVKYKSAGNTRCRNF